MEHGKNKEPGGVWTEKISRRLLAAFSRDYSKLEKITDLEGVGMIIHQLVSLATLDGRTSESCDPATLPIFTLRVARKIKI